MKVAVVIPTYNAGDLWGSCLEALDKQVYGCQKLVIDSSSQDDTVTLARQYDLDVITIKQELFDHGGSRQQAVRVLKNIDVVVFLTQDALLSDVESLNEIIKPFCNTEVVAVCGRQLPRKAAKHIEMHARLYNYPTRSAIKSLSDKNKFGLKTAFISNSYAAYRVSILNEVGGFPNNVIFGEDMYVAAKILKAGYKIAYAADACVDHSHNYSIKQEMQRYFDMGVFHAREPWIREELGGAEGEGVKFVISEFKYLLKHAFWLIPEGMLRTLFRYTGFRLGLIEKRLPQWLKRRLAMNKGFFHSN